MFYGTNFTDFVTDKLPSDLGFANHIKNENACGVFVTVLPEQFSNSPCQSKIYNAGALANER
jgi:hypothetical protein